MLSAIKNFAYFKLLRTVWREVPHYRRQFGWAIIFAFMAQIISMAGPYLFGQSINAIQSADYKLAIILTVISLVRSLVSWSFHLPARIFETHMGALAKQAYSEKLYHILQKLPISWHSNHHSGAVLDQVTKSSDALRSFCGNHYNYPTVVCQMTIPVVILFFLSPIIALISLLTIAISLLVIIKCDNYITPVIRHMNKLGHKINALLFDYISNIRTLITLRVGARTEHELHHRYNDLTTVNHRYAVLNEIKWLSKSFIYEAGVCLTVIIVILSTKHTSTIQAGSVVMIISYLRTISDAFSGLAMNYGALVRYGLDLETADPILVDYAALKLDETVGTNLDNWQNIAVKNLTFNYETASQQPAQLKDIALNFARGRNIAVVGPSGGGKSTLLSLLRGLYATEPLSLNIDGQKFNSLQPLAYTTTLIPQDPEIFENTIGFNITLGLDVAEAELQQIMQLAAFDDVLQILPQGLDSDIREKGVNLSGGQKQRLALARGLLAATDSSLVLLDEPTSSVDSATEQRIYQQILENFPHKTIISTLHRLHLLPMFDEVWVINQGQLVQVGSFADLCADTNGLFAQMWQHYQIAQAQGLEG